MIATRSQHIATERMQVQMIRTCATKLADDTRNDTRGCVVYHNEIPGAEWYAVYPWLE